MKKTVILLLILSIGVSLWWCSIKQNTENEKLLKKISNLEQQLDEKEKISTKKDNIDIKPITEKKIVEKIKTEPKDSKNNNSLWKYYIDDNSVLCKDCLFPWIAKLVDVDIESFKVLNWWYYAKDKNNSFWLGAKIWNTDQESFIALSEFYAKDSKNVFFETYIVNWIDPDSTEITSKFVASDKSSLFIC